MSFQDEIKASRIRDAGKAGADLGWLLQHTTAHK